MKLMLSSSNGECVERPKHPHTSEIYVVVNFLRKDAGTNEWRAWQSGMHPWGSLTDTGIVVELDEATGCYREVPP